MDEVASHEQHQKIADWLGTGSINIFGRPFAGKDTQAHRLAELLNAPVIGGGDILRSQAATPKHVLKTIDQGKLAPRKEYLKIMAPYFSQQAFKGHPLILSSVGRWHGEEEGILQILSAAGHPLKAVVFLNLDETSAHKRWELAVQHNKRGSREDDAPGRLQVRFNEFRLKTIPVINFYRRNGLLIEIDGSLSPDNVTSAILAKLAKFAETI